MHVHHLLVTVFSLLFKFESSTGEFNRTDITYTMADLTRCKEESPDVLIWVQGRATSPHLRSMIRETVANEKNWPADIKVMTVFFMGKVKDENIQHMLEYEFEIYGDIVQTNFTESYENIVYKMITAINYISEYCYGLKLVLKVDDDVVFHPAMMLTELIPIMAKNTEDELSLDLIPSKTLACYLHTRETIDRLRDKPTYQYAVKDEILPGRTKYPPFCAGFFMLMSGDVPRLLQPHLATTPTFWMDDKYMGILQEKANIINIDVHSKLDYGYHSFTEENMNDMTLRRVVVQHLPSTLELYLSQIFHYLDTCGDVEFETIKATGFVENSRGINLIGRYYKQRMMNVVNEEYAKMLQNRTLMRNELKSLAGNKYKKAKKKLPRNLNNLFRLLS